MNGNNRTPRKQGQVLLGNTFTVSLIRRRATITPAGLDKLRSALATRGGASFWGHANTLAAAREILGMDVSPASKRPAMGLTAEGFPSQESCAFRECWVLSPEYEPGFRPE